MMLDGNGATAELELGLFREGWAVESEDVVPVVDGPDVESAIVTGSADG